jgi:hypothetical protein
LNGIGIVAIGAGRHAFICLSIEVYRCCDSGIIIATRTVVEISRRTSFAGQVASQAKIDVGGALIDDVLGGIKGGKDG